MLDDIDGSVSAYGSVFHGPVVGVNLGTIVYGRLPEESERQHLVHYLEQLANSHRKMRVAGLGITRLESGIDLASVYIMLAVQGRYWAVRNLTTAERFAHQQYEFTLPSDLSIDNCLPDQAIVDVGNDKYRGLVLLRSELATETVLHHQHLVLCGAPGSGKSTFVKHLVWALALRGLDQINPQTTLVGLPDRLRLLPIFVPLRQLAGMLANKDLGLNADPKIGFLLDALGEYLHNQYGLNESQHLLEIGLRQQGKVLFVFDGLDEIPLEATPHSLDRTSVLTFLRIFADCKPNARMLITCRSRAWTEEYRRITHWPMHELAPLTGGQITHFIGHWFPQLVEKGVLNSDEALRYTEQLLLALNDPKRSALRMMAKNPLLLSMMVFVLAENGVLPRDRHSLYEQILSQLLGQWDAKRESQNLGQAIGAERITSQELRNQVLDRVCYQAHLNTMSEDGRGRIQGRDLKQELMDYFAKASVPDPYYAAERCITYIDHRSGLIHPEDDGNTYVFAHLTLQEYSAGRHLLFHESITTILALRRDDRWREPIFLGVGCLTSESLGAAKIEQLLTALTEQYEYHGDPKPLNDWYRDLVLAAELGFDRDWGLLGGKNINIQRIKRILRDGLTQLLNDRDHAQAALDYFQGKSIIPAPLLIKERQTAAELLAGLGDPRYPVSIEQWRDITCQLSQQFGRDGTHYWRYIPAGRYQIYGRDEERLVTILDLQPYWMGRFMITVQQYDVFIKAGGYKQDTWWLEDGLRWKNENHTTIPHWWEEQIHQEHMNQPVYGVTWYEAMAYASWLNAQLEPVLPLGYQICLAYEDEWVVATAYNGQAQAQSYPWGEQPATFEHAVYDWSEKRHPLSVGLSLIGQSASGVIDAVGNLWEWTATPYDNSHGEVSRLFREDSEDSIVIRGGSHWDSGMDMMCMVRSRSYATRIMNVTGFRCILAPR